MSLLSQIAGITRSKGDPKVIESGTSSLDQADRLARGLGWLSMGLGALLLVAPGRVANALGMQGSETLLRAYGARECVSGMLTLSPDKSVGLWSRVGGDALDIATLLMALDRYNPKRDNVKAALAVVGGIAVLDFMAAVAVTRNAARSSEPLRLDYGNRSGFPKGIEHSRGAASSMAHALSSRTNGAARLST